MSTSTATVINVGSADAFQQAIESDQLTVVDFWAPWCGPCQAYGPVLEAYASSAPENVQVVKVNVDDHQETAASFGIRSIPSTLFFRSGEEIGRANGLLNQQQLSAQVDSHL